MTLLNGFLENPVWGLPIVIYPFLSGLVAGSFVVASLSHLFGMEKFRPLAKLAAIVSFAMLILAAQAPLADALQPSRAIWELYFRDHFPYSPLGMFIIIWTLYMILMLFEMYYLFRVANITRAKEYNGFRGKLADFFTLGNKDLSEKAAKKDHKALMIIAALGIGLAFLFHGYVGFLFGAIKARPLWSNPLIPVLFITSAIVSGIALMGVLYVIGFSFYSDKNKVKSETVSELNKILLLMIGFDLFFDLIEWLYSVRSYAPKDLYEGWHSVFSTGAGGVLAFNYHFMQITLGLIIPGLLLISKKVRNSKVWTVIIGFLVLIGVWSMRFNTVIGAQLQTKIGQGTVLFSIPWLGYDGYITGIGLFALGIFLIFVFGYLLGWEDKPELTGNN
ncbi:MAG: NrfD/PsrC family molybdoenzyme membrane anchor subunit [bacterium]